MKPARSSAKGDPSIKAEGDELFATVGTAFDMRFKIRTENIGRIDVDIAVWKVATGFQLERAVQGTNAVWVEKEVARPGGSHPYRVNFTVTPKAPVAGTTLLVQVYAPLHGFVGFGTIGVKDVTLSGSEAKATSTPAKTTADEDDDLRILIPVRTPIGVGHKR